MRSIFRTGRRLGDALQKLERYDDAIACYDKATEIDPKDTYFWVNKGMSFLQLKKYEEAIKSYRNAQKIYPSIQSAGIMIPKLQELIKKEAI